MREKFLPASHREFIVEESERNPLISNRCEPRITQAETEKGWGGF